MTVLTQLSVGLFRSATFVEFFATAFLLGAAGGCVLSGDHGHSNSALLLPAAMAAVTALALKLVRLRFASRYELFASWQLISGPLLNKLIFRLAMLVLGTALLALCESISVHALGLTLLVTGEFMGRYLFFVSVVPSNIASSYLAQDAA